MSDPPGPTSETQSPASLISTTPRARISIRWLPSSSMMRISELDSVCVRDCDSLRGCCAQAGTASRIAAARARVRIGGVMAPRANGME
jgi:hypothetical protein